MIFSVAPAAASVLAAPASAVGPAVGPVPGSSGPAASGQADAAIDEARERVLDRLIETPEDQQLLRENLRQQVRNLDTSERLLDVLEDQETDPLATGVEAAEIATRHQAATLGVAMPDTVPTPAHDSPSAAASALAERLDVELSAEQQEELAELDRVDEPVRTELTDVIDAFIGFHDATEQAFADADSAELAEIRERARTSTLAASPQAGSTSSLVEAGVDLGPVFTARTQMLASIVDLRDALEATSASSAQSSTVNQCPVIAVDLDGVDSSYTTDCVLIIDIGGGDDYDNNAGGTSFTAWCSDADDIGAAALVDLGTGIDEYGNPDSPEFCGANGGVYGEGAGFLLDGGGNDLYVAGTNGVNGAAVAGSGFLLDVGGTDVYDAIEMSNGAAVGGSGALLDLGAGSELYGNTFGTRSPGNGAAMQGSGFLLDGGGDDEYSIEDDGPFNGGASGPGSGFLLDASGNDNYNIESDNNEGWEGTNGGSSAGGAGFLLDSAGDDQYPSTKQGINGGVHGGGSGLLVDAAGQDQYIATSDGVNGGVDGTGFGLLYDHGSTGDEYQDNEGGTGTDKTVLPKGTYGAQLDSTSLFEANTSGTEEATLAHVDNATLTPSIALPPIGEDVATITVQNEQRNGADVVCVYVTPDGGSQTELACVNRALLGPADNLVPRGSTTILEKGALGTTSKRTVTVNASYSYDPGELTFLASGPAGTDVYSPIGLMPGDASWYALNGDAVPLTVTVWVYEDGQQTQKTSVEVPYLGQAIAATEASAGTGP